MIQGFGKEITEIPAFGHDITEVRAMGQLAWQKSIPDYLCFTALEAGRFTLTIPAAVTPTYLSYIEWSKDGRTWNHTDNTSEAVTIDVQVASGDKVYWRGSGVCTTSASASTGRQSIFSSTARFDASGRVMSLLKGDDCANYDHLERNTVDGCLNVTFARLFSNCDTIVNAKDLVLPTFTSFHTYIYYSMFYGCGALVSLPPLLSTALAGNCYANLAFGCASLLNAVPLPATTLANGCYNSMYYGCTSLTKGSDLPATNLVLNCYYMMYNGCSSLTDTGTLGFLVTAESSCDRMFQSCSHLNYIKCLATDISATNCLRNWTNGVVANGTFIQAEGVEWPRGASGIPTGWVDIEKRTMPSGYKQVESITPTIGSYFQLTAYAMDNHYSIEIGYRGSSEEIADATNQQQIAGYNLADAANLKQMCGYIYTRQNTGAQVWAQRNAGVYTNPNTGQQSLNSSSLTSTFTLDTNPHTFVYLPDSSAESIKFIIDGTVVQTYGKNYYDASNQNPIPTGAPYKLYKITILRPLQRGTTYYLKGYASDNTTLATDCVPCIRTSDNKVGLYDFVESTFEEGTGTFTAGEEI